MAGGDEILVDEEARGIVSSLEATKPANPSAGAARAVSGPTPTDASVLYQIRMREFAVAAQQTAQRLIDGIKADSANAVVAIDDFNRQDQEIMEMLKRLQSETVVGGAGTGAGGMGTGSQQDTTGQSGANSSWVKK